MPVHIDRVKNVCLAVPMILHFDHSLVICESKQVLRVLWVGFKNYQLRVCTLKYAFNFQLLLGILMIDRDPNDFISWAFLDETIEMCCVI